MCFHKFPAGNRLNMNPFIRARRNPCIRARESLRKRTHFHQEIVGIYELHIFPLGNRWNNSYSPCFLKEICALPKSKNCLFLFTVLCHGFLASCYQPVSRSQWLHTGSAQPPGKQHKFPLGKREGRAHISYWKFAFFLPGSCALPMWIHWLRLTGW